MSASSPMDDFQNDDLESNLSLLRREFPVTSGTPLTTTVSALNELPSTNFDVYIWAVPLWSRDGKSEAQSVHSGMAEFLFSQGAWPMGKMTREEEIWSKDNDKQNGTEKWTQAQDLVTSSHRLSTPFQTPSPTGHEMPVVTPKRQIKRRKSPEVPLAPRYHRKKMQTRWTPYVRARKASMRLQECVDTIMGEDVSLVGRNTI